MFLAEISSSKSCIFSGGKKKENLFWEYAAGESWRGIRKIAQPNLSINIAMLR